MRILLLIIISFFAIQNSYASNTNIESFRKSKRLLERHVYFDHRETIYCGAAFDGKKNITTPQGFTTNIYKKRAQRVEWEHIVPAENFGRNFTAWRDGDDDCVKRTGKKYKGRKCARKVSKDFRLMEADMYNLHPAIGAVNAARSNYNFGILDSELSDFGTCNVKIDNKIVEPPVEARGRIARAYLYMDEVYANYSMSSKQRQLMQAWNKQYPVSTFECQRYQRILNTQGNDNPVLSRECNSL